MPEFDAHVLLVCEDAAKLVAGREQDATVLDLLSAWPASRLHQATHCLDDLVIVLADQSNVRK